MTLDHNHFQLILNSLASSIAVYDCDLRIRYLNSAARQVIRLPEGVYNPIGLHLNDLNYPAEFLASFRTLIRHTLETQKPQSSELEGVFPDGRRWYAVNATPTFDAEGQIEGVICVAKNITSNHEAEAKLRERETSYRQIVSQGQVFAWKHDHRTGRSDLEAEYLAMIGLSQESAPRNSDEWGEWFHPDDRVHVERILLECDQSFGTHYEYPFRATDGNGQIRWFLVRANVKRDETGRRIEEAGVLVEITERRQAELALEASEARFAAFMVNSPALAWIKDEQGRYEFINPAYAKRFQLSAERTRGLTDAEIFPATVAEQFRSNDELVRSTQTAITVTEYTDEADGGKRPWMVAKFPLPNRHVGGFSIDMGEIARLEEEQRKVERQMLQTQKLESLGVLAGGIAHDFNNLLTSVMGYASLARMEPGVSADVQSHLGQIEAAAQRAAELCKQMLAYAGRGTVTIQPVELNTLVQEMAQLLSTAISKRATLKFNLTSNLPVVRADPTQIRQVVMNLITNASDAIGEQNGVIAITTGAIDADTVYLTELGMPTLPPKRYACIEVSDTGVGMTEEVQARVFEPFFTTKFTGRGLGLAAVQGIVRAHGGAIKIYSQVGRGTTFKVLLPISDDPSEFGPAREPIVETGFGRGRWVLVVDDDEDVRVLARKLLTRSGFQVMTANDGLEAVTTFRIDPDRYAAILLDLTMPRMNGIEAFRLLRQARPDVKVILTSGYSAEEATMGFQGKGLGSFVRKPFLVGELMAAIADAVNN